MRWLIPTLLTPATNASGVKVSPAKWKTAVGCAHDRDSSRVGDAFFDQPVNAIDQILVHLAAPFFVAGMNKLSTVTCRTAGVDLEHGVTAIGKPLDRAMKTPAIA
jgi:hypothetical protein